VLIGDIDRGGVIASIVGTQALLEEAERTLLRGYIVNRFRGDVRLFDDGIEAIGDRTGLTCFGVVPYLAAARRLPAEDSLALDAPPERRAGAAIRIAVPRTLHISNFDDLDPLAAEPDVALTMVAPGEALPGDADLVILPGTKATIPAMRHFREQGWDIDLAAHRRRGGHVLGICGGYQMLGNRVADPDGLEGPAGAEDGLGLLDVETVLAAPKTLSPVRAASAEGLGNVTGYEMHMGVTTGQATARPMLDIGGRGDGAVAEGGAVSGCYVHGLFAADGFRHAFLNRMRARAPGVSDFEASVDAALDEIAVALEAELDIEGLLAAAEFNAGAAA
jgi:adenosylcobyric acid synthase